MRATANFVATKSSRGIRITAKERGVTPKSRVVSLSTWDELSKLADLSFDMACVWDLGIGAFKKPDWRIRFK